MSNLHLARYAKQNSDSSLFSRALIKVLLLSGHQIEVFQILNGYENSYPMIVSKLRHVKQLGHDLKVQIKLDIRKVLILPNNHKLKE